MEFAANSTHTVRDRQKNVVKARNRFQGLAVKHEGRPPRLKEARRAEANMNEQ